MSRKTHKTPEQMRNALVELYGSAYGSQRQLAKDLGRHEVSVSRYCTGDSPVDETTARLIDALLEKHRAKHKRRAEKPIRNIADMF